MQDEIFPAIDSDAVRFDIVWTRAWGQPTSEAQASELTPSNSGPRLRVWFDGDNRIGTGLAEFYSGTPPLYDLFLVYPDGSVWDVETDTPGEADEMWRNGLTSSEAEDMLEAIEERLPDCSVILPGEDRP
ncbi:MAG: hypothetical protein GY898_15980 [Proteobacteria bacterium]|nr:hypothetical protein [Pseudomonadota bacterium]